MDILLLDLDDVLLETHAYHDSLTTALDLISASLGFGRLDLTDDEIRSFEAAGVTAEWDSSAITVALLLDQVARCGGHPCLPYALPHPASPAGSYPRPDLLGFIELLAGHPGTGAHPRQTAESILLARPDGRTAETTAVIRDVLQNGYDIERSVSHRLIEELNLGSRAFAEVYGLSPWLTGEGFLQTRDHPGLSRDTRRRLLDWLGSPDHAACVFTNRPCARPDGRPIAPELELGLRAAQLPDLPAIGLGHLAWLAEQRRAAGPYAFLKPSPVHALAAMRCALGDPPEIAVRRAADLSDGGAADSSWHRLDGATILALDDAVKGVRSALEAQRVAGRAGVRFDVTACGVTTHPAKVRALREFGARVYPAVESALEQEAFWSRRGKG